MKIKVHRPLYRYRLRYCGLVLAAFGLLAGALPPRQLRAETEATPQEQHDLSYRTWSSVSGDTIEAAFINLHQGQLSLLTRQGDRIVIPMHRLTWRNQITARRLADLPGTDPKAPTQPRTFQNQQPAPAQVFTAFGPACEVLLIEAIAGAEHEILVAIYTLTSENIASALLAALDRGVKIQLKYDVNQMETGRMQEWISALEKNGAAVTPIKISGWYASMHHKFCVLDQTSVFTGSYNFTVSAATTNDENAVLIRSDPVAAAFSREFTRIQTR